LNETQERSDPETPPPASKVVAKTRKRLLPRSLSAGDDISAFNMHLLSPNDPVVKLADAISKHKNLFTWVEEQCSTSKMAYEFAKIYIILFAFASCLDGFHVLFLPNDDTLTREKLIHYRLWLKSEQFVVFFSEAIEKLWHRLFRTPVSKAEIMRTARTTITGMGEILGTQEIQKKATAALYESSKHFGLLTHEGQTLSAIPNQDIEELEEQLTVSEHSILILKEHLRTERDQEKIKKLKEELSSLGKQQMILIQKMKYALSNKRATGGRRTRRASNRNRNRSKRLQLNKARHYF
jgi:hypothetical protein